MKKIRFKISCFVISLIFIIGFNFINTRYVLAKKSPNLVFPVISDVHIGGKDADEKFIKALSYLKHSYPRYDAISIVGDITNGGKIEQYTEFMKILNEHKAASAESIITMGNHEYFSSKDIKEDGCEKCFVKETKMPSLYYDKWVKGYHFIVLSPEKGACAKLSTEQLTWLKDTIQKKEDSNKPIFVFLHQPIKNTVYGSNDCGDIENYRALNEILKKHSQVIFFSGHSHYLLEHPRTMYKNNFTLFNTSAVYYTCIENDVKSSPVLSQGLLVEVYDKKVVVKCRDFSRNKWIGKGYTIDYPITSDFVGEKRNPFWNKNDEIKVINKKQGTVIISWPKAKDDTLVTSYIIKANGKVVNKVINNFLKPEQNYYNYEVKGLKSSIRYNIEIEAVDAFNNKAINSLKITI